MEGYRFSLRDLPQRELLEDYSERFNDLNKDAVESCIALLRTASDLAKAFDRHFALYNLTEGRFTLLMLLYREKGPLTPAALSEKSEVTRATVTGLITGLAAQGLVEKIPNPNDQRGYWVCLTPQGTELLENLLPAHYRLVNQLMAGLKHDQLEQLRALLILLRKNLSD